MQSALSHGMATELTSDMRNAFDGLSRHLNRNHGEEVLASPAAAIFLATESLRNEMKTRDAKIGVLGSALHHFCATDTCSSFASKHGLRSTGWGRLTED